jgi:hypothetical protein
MSSSQPPSAPGPWSPQPQHPAWPQEGWPQQPWPPQAWAPQPPARDSTRVIAIVALVVAVVALVGALLVTVLPMLLFGLFGAVAGESFDEGWAGPSVGSAYGGRVEPAADGSVAGPTLAGAVVEVASVGPEDDLAGRVSCDPVPRVAADVSVLCRADDPRWYGIVRFTDADGSFDVVMVGPDETMP